MNKSEIGLNAGKVWQLLSDYTRWSYGSLKRKSGLKDKELGAALGWLAREKHCETSGGRGLREILGFALCFEFDFSFGFERFDRPAEALMRVQQSAFVFKRFIYGLSQQIKV